MRWKKCQKTSPDCCMINSRKGTQRKMDKLPFTACFVSLMLSCKIANIHWKPASDTAPTVSESAGSPHPTQFERVNCIGIKNLIYILVFVLF